MDWRSSNKCASKDLDENPTFDEYPYRTDLVLQWQQQQQQQQQQLDGARESAYLCQVNLMGVILKQTLDRGTFLKKFKGIMLGLSNVSLNSTNSTQVYWKSLLNLESVGIFINTVYVPTPPGWPLWRATYLCTILPSRML